MKHFWTIGFLLIAAGTPLSVTAATDVSVQDLAGLQLSGYANNDLLQWTISAKSAELTPESKNVKNPTKNGVWNVRDLRLAFFSEAQKNIEMHSETAQFFPKEKCATSDAKIFVNSEIFSVQGKGWQWQNGENANRVEVKNDVIVTILRQDETDESVPEKTAKTEPEKIVVTAKTLTIINDDVGTLMRFAGAVTVLYGDVFMNADALEIALPIGKADSADLGTQGKGLKGLSAISSICGKGNAILRNRDQIAAGDEVEFVPSKDLVFVRGNAQFEDTQSKVVVRGDRGNGNIKTKHFELDGAAGTAGVEIEMPSLAMKQQKGVPINPLQRAILTGTKLIIDLKTDENILTLDGNVKLRDGDWNMSADWLCAKTTRDNQIEGEIAETSEVKNNDLSAVKSLVVRGNVKMFNVAQTLSCEQAELFPQQKRVLLTGTPTIQSHKENATLRGNSAEIFYEDERILVESDPAGTIKRVTATLPAMKDLRDKQATKNAPKMLATGDKLEVTRNGDLVVFDITGTIKIVDPELSANADRVVVFVLDKKASVQNRVPANRAPQIQRIDILGNMMLENASGRMTGNSAIVENNVKVAEWIESDEGADGARPVRVLVEPDPAKPQTTRPRFFMADENQDFKNYIEGDHLEVLLGESRVRFWLRNNVRLMTEDARGKCNTLEGLCLPQAPKNQMALERVVGRGNVNLEHGTSLALGNLLELFPQQNLAVLSGKAKMIDEQGIAVTPGEDRFVFDTKTRELTTYAVAEEKVGHGKKTMQVSRPKITISGESNFNFSVPAQKK